MTEPKADKEGHDRHSRPKETALAARLCIHFGFFGLEFFVGVPREVFGLHADFLKSFLKVFAVHNVLLEKNKNVFDDLCLGHFLQLSQRALKPLASTCTKLS